MIRPRFPSPRRTLHTAAAGLAAALLAGCATDHALVRGGAVRNTSSRELTEISVTHLPSGRMVYTHDLPAGGALRLEVHEGELRATAATVRWHDPRLGDRETRLPLDNHAHGDAPMFLVYELDDAGDARVHFEPADRR